MHACLGCHRHFSFIATKKFINAGRRTALPMRYTDLRNTSNINYHFVQPLPFQWLWLGANEH